MTQGTTETRINLPGFTKEATELVRDIEGYGWVFRPSNHGVVGRSPDGKATVAVGRKSSRTNRAYQNTNATFKRWLRQQHPEAAAAADAYQEEIREAEELAETEPIIGEILSRRALVRTAEKISQIETAREAQDEGSTTDMPKESIIDTRPWHPKAASNRDGIVRVTERIWANGNGRQRTDYACAMPGCPYTSASSRSVTQHYGSAHTMRMVAALAPVEPVEVTSVKPVVEDVTVAYVEAQQYGMMTPVEEMPFDAHHVVNAIRMLVSEPLMEQINDLLADVANRENENARLTQERDEAVAQLAKIQSDLDALRSLIASIGIPSA